MEISHKNPDFEVHVHILKMKENTDIKIQKVSFKLQNTFLQL